MRAQRNPKFYLFKGLRGKAPKKRPRRRVRAETTDKGGGDKYEVSHDIDAAQGETCAHSKTLMSLGISALSDQ